MSATGLRGSHGPGEKIVLTTHFGTPGLRTLDVYQRLGGYGALKKALGMKQADLVEEVKTSGLRGRGGAGFPTGMKWSFMAPPDGGPRYVVVNADESEPGTSKDRYIMENSPHLLLEGILIAQYAVDSHQAWIYIRGEYDEPHHNLIAAIEELRQAGILGPKPFGKDHPLDIRLYRGHGAYICGEETALLDSLEGKRSQPRPKPPFPAVQGAWGRPTLINNVETLSTVPWIIEHGAAEYAKLGTERSHGTRLVSVSGQVQRPGVYEIEFGVTFEHVLMELGGGPLPGRTLKAYYPGGSSAPVIPASDLSLTTDMEALAAAGSMAGSGGIIVVDDSWSIVDATYRLLQFYAWESCGKCTPCRVGGDWATRTLKRMVDGEGTPADIEILRRVADSTLGGRCLCALGDSVGLVLNGALRHFLPEFEAAVKQPAPSRRPLEALASA
ncbi:MAG: NADH-quinone oxidoreductase subunit NuoF [Candidatus Dormibacteraceae bacterium]